MYKIYFICRRSLYSVFHLLFIQNTRRIMTPQKLPKHSINNDRSNIGKCYELAVHGGKKGTAILYHHSIETERVDLSDTPAKRIFIVRLVERKVNQRRLAEKLNISRQTSNFSKSEGKIKRAFEFLILYHV